MSVARRIVVKGSMDGLQRITEKTDGWDCVHKPCGRNGCGTNPGSNHGVGCDEWIYTVTDGKVALMLCVFSGVFPSTVERSPGSPRWPSDSRAAKYPDGYSMNAHVAYPTDRGEVLVKPEECPYLTDKLCWSHELSLLHARDFYQQIKDACALEETEAFWIKLEAEWRSVAERYKTPTEYARCTHCDGTGTVLGKR